MLPRIVYAKPPKRSRATKKLRPPPPCGVFVEARHPKQIAALRMRSEVLSEVVRAEPVPIRRTIGGTRKATAEEIAECLSFARHDDPMMAKIAAERILEHLQSCGFVLMATGTGRHEYRDARRYDSSDAEPA